MTRIARSAAVLLVLTVLAFAAPSRARAADCGTDYVHCVATTIDIRSSDLLHEQQCYGDYIRCVAISILAW